MKKKYEDGGSVSSKRDARKANRQEKRDNREIKAKAKYDARVDKAFSKNPALKEKFRQEDLQTMKTGGVVNPNRKTMEALCKDAYASNAKRRSMMKGY